AQPCRLMIGPTRRRLFEKGPHRDASDVTPTSLRPAPKTRERAITSVDRILAWKRDLGDRRQGAIVVRRARPAFVITAEGRIRAAHEQILAGGKPLVAGPGRQDHYIAGLEVEFPSAFAAEANPGMAARNTEHFVSPRVIMRVIVNAVAPGIAPAIACKQLFKHRRRVKILREADRAAVKEKRQRRIVRNCSVVLETERIRLAAPDRVTKIAARRTFPARHLLHPFLHAFQHAHDAASSSLLNLPQPGRTGGRDGPPQPLRSASWRTAVFERLREALEHAVLERR